MNNIEKIYIGSKQNPEVFVYKNDDDDQFCVVWEGQPVGFTAATIEECDREFAAIQAIVWDAV